MQAIALGVASGRAFEKPAHLSTLLEALGLSNGDVRFHLGFYKRAPGLPRTAIVTILHSATS